MTEAQGSDHLVVVGASAGGIEALGILFGTLDPGFPAPIVVAQHLDPRRESRLGEILARRTSLPVVIVTDQAPLLPGTIHVVPPDRQVAVTDHEIRLVTAGPEGRPAPSVDRLFDSAATQFGDRLVAIILSGTGSDGADGARRVKMRGGTVVIQDPHTARYPSMPASLASAIVDIAAPVEAIGPIVRDLVTGARTVAGGDEEPLLAGLLAAIRDRSGIDFTSYKRPTILRRLERRMAATGTASLREYVRYVDRNEDELQRLTSSLLIKVTEFFRDEELFARLRDTVVPDVIANARPHGRDLRIWSAGCATGEEAYSLAILVADALGDELEDWHVRIFATDLDADAVAFARRGRYPRAALEHLPPELVERCFTETNGTYEVRKLLRSITVFGVHDLAQRPPFPRIDLALCRNVLIYFTPELQRRALQLFAFALRDGGWLALGKAESSNPLPEHFVLEDAQLKLFRRRGDRLVEPPVRLRRDDVAALRPAAVRPVTPPPAAVGGHADRVPPELERGDALLAVVPVGILTVDRRYDIVSINPAARRLLGIHSRAIGEDLIHLAPRLPATELRGILDEALAGRRGVLRVEVKPPADPEAAASSLELTADPAAEGPAGVPAGVVVTVRGVVDPIAVEREREGPAEPVEPTSVAELRRHVDEYRESNQRLLRENEELAAAAADLTRANEELLVSNEEVQAATEEVETLNEELQATNEELETLNEELQATIEELNTTNDDLEATAAELQHLTVDLEAQRATAETERARLATLIETMRDGVLVVDRAGAVVLRNEAFDRMFAPDAPVPEDESGARVDPESLRARVVAGDEFGFTFSTTGSDGRRRWYEAYGHQVPLELGIGDGGIVIVHDTTDLSMRRLQEEFVAIVAHELRTPLTALRGYLQMLRRRGVDDPNRPVLPLAADQAERLQRLVDELFDVTRLDRGRLALTLDAVSLNKLIDETVEIATGLSDRHRFSVDRPAADVVVIGDAARLQQVLLNLLTNAIVHAPTAPDVQIRVRKLRQRIEIDVEDHGPGIPPDAQAVLFLPFEQGRAAAVRSGLGLGLYIAREIVHLHGGAIDVDSDVGQGTTFTVRLPLTPRAGGPRTDGRQPERPAVDAPGTEHVPVNGDGSSGGAPRDRKATRR